MKTYLSLRIQRERKISRKVPTWLGPQGDRKQQRQAWICPGRAFGPSSPRGPQLAGKAFLQQSPQQSDIFGILLESAAGLLSDLESFFIFATSRGFK